MLPSGRALKELEGLEGIEDTKRTQAWRIRELRYPTVLKPFLQTKMDESRGTNGKASLRLMPR
jgi:hypothetical protein